MTVMSPDRPAGDDAREDGDDHGLVGRPAHVGAERGGWGERRAIFAAGQRGDERGGQGAATAQWHVPVPESVKS